MYELVIVGAGPAGLYAATCAAMNELNAVVIESSQELGGQLTLYKDKAVYDMPGFAKISGGELVLSFYEQYKTYEKEVPIMLNTQALDVIHYDDHFDLITNQGTIQTKTILLANGGGMFQPKKLDVPFADQYPMIHYAVKNIMDYKNLNVVVLGGGDSAVDWALSLNTIAKSVTLVHRRHDFRAHQRNVDMFKEQGTILTPYIAKTLHGDEKLQGLTLENTETKEEVLLKADAILVFYGATPVRSKADIWKVHFKDNSILVKQNMQTSCHRIYAVGNSITYEGKLKMIVTALGEAATAIGAITKYLYPAKTHSYKH
ncbi:MAG: NAD(P)/FAD-dependent oxidoreductase [Acholeplasma sp.]|jgi:thioredoxin reductase (NADPH)|nr:MAG: NAD(P)/FAD-dependent oxidoreductase [Acholeplasma sp.]